MEIAQCNFFLHTVSYQMENDIEAPRMLSIIVYFIFCMNITDIFLILILQFQIIPIMK